MDDVFNGGLDPIRKNLLIPEMSEEEGSDWEAEYNQLSEMFER